MPRGVMGHLHWDLGHIPAKHLRVRAHRQGWVRLLLPEVVLPGLEMHLLHFLHLPHLLYLLHLQASLQLALLAVLRLVQVARGRYRCWRAELLAEFRNLLLEGLLLGEHLRLHLLAEIFRLLLEGIVLPLRGLQLALQGLEVVLGGGVPLGIAWKIYARINRLL